MQQASMMATLGAQQQSAQAIANAAAIRTFARSQDPVQIIYPDARSGFPMYNQTETREDENAGIGQTTWSPRTHTSMASSPATTPAISPISMSMGTQPSTPMSTRTESPTSMDVATPPVRKSTRGRPDAFFPSPTSSDGGNLDLGYVYNGNTGAPSPPSDVPSLRASAGDSDSDYIPSHYSSVNTSLAPTPVSSVPSLASGRSSDSSSYIPSHYSSVDTSLASSPASSVSVGDYIPSPHTSPAQTPRSTPEYSPLPSPMPSPVPSPSNYAHASLLDRLNQVDASNMWLTRLPSQPAPKLPSLSPPSTSGPSYAPAAPINNIRIIPDLLQSLSSPAPPTRVRDRPSGLSTPDLGSDAHVSNWVVGDYDPVGYLGMHSRPSSLNTSTMSSPQARKRGEFYDV